MYMYLWNENSFLCNNPVTIRHKGVYIAGIPSTVYTCIMCTFFYSTNMEDLREKTHTEHYEIFRRRRLQEMGFADTGEDNQPVRYAPADVIVPGKLVTVSVTAQNHNYWFDFVRVACMPVFS